MKCLNHSCQGESHKAANKVCQDCSFSHVYGDGTAVAVVCDGHGGKRYFRSDIGAKAAVEITVQNVRLFLAQQDASAFCGKPFTQQGPIPLEAPDDFSGKLEPMSPVFRQLFSSILSGWHKSIERHAIDNPLTDLEKATVEQKYQDEFLQGDCVEKTYGCTLMCCVCTSQYWLAFHIGDGKCVAFDEEGKSSEPIPWDDRCFLNKTTSICDSNAINEFRYCYCGDGTFPQALFLGSDGIDDTFGSDERLANFYIQILKSINKDGLESVKQDLIDDLPVLSKRGSQDDMSVAGIFYDQELPILTHKLVLRQIDRTKEALYTVNDQILSHWRIQRGLESAFAISSKDRIELDYAKTGVEKAYQERNKLINRLRLLLQESGDQQTFYFRDNLGRYPKCLGCALSNKCNTTE